MADDHSALPTLVRMVQESAEAYLEGDLDTYVEALGGDLSTTADVPLKVDEFTLMPPFGGPVTHGFVLDDETREATRRTFRGGRVEVEVDASYVTDDLAVLAVVERQRGLIGDSPEQDWSLRVTLAFRRDGEQWRLVHRHADALVRPIGWNTLTVGARRPA